MNKKTVVLFGTNTFTRHLIPWDQPDTEFWCWNEIGSLKDDRPDYWAKKVDLLIQIHAPAIWRNPSNLNHTGHYAWLQKQHNIPIYMQEHYDDVPSSVRYPKEEIVETLLPNIWRDVHGDISKVENFTSSTAYALALAIYKGYERIEIAGIEMASDTEYVRQRPGVFFWLGIATGRGIDVVIHSPMLMKDNLYGYTGEVMITRQQFEMASRKLETLAERQKEKAFEAKGKSNAMLNAMLLSTDAIQAKRLLAAFTSALNEAQEANFEYGRLAGVLDENRRYMKQCDDLIMAAGGEKSLKVMMGILDNVKEEIGIEKETVEA